MRRLTGRISSKCFLKNSLVTSRLAFVYLRLLLYATLWFRRLFAECGVGGFVYMKQRAVLLWTLVPAERDAYLANEATKVLTASKWVIMEIACSRSAQELLLVRQAYHARYKKSLEEDVAYHTSGDFRKVCPSIHHPPHPPTIPILSNSALRITVLCNCWTSLLWASFFPSSQSRFWVNLLRLHGHHLL